MNPAQIAAKFYDARDAMKFLLKEDYQERVAEYQQYIKAQMAKTGVGELEATMQVVKLLQDRAAGNGVAQSLILAACLEMIEGLEPALEAVCGEVA